MVLQLVKDDPFASISELRREIARRTVREVPGWWQVFNILRKHRMLTRKARFVHARGRRGWD